MKTLNASIIVLFALCAGLLASPAFQGLQVAPTTQSRLAMIGKAALQYAQDNDGSVVPTVPNAAQIDKPWPVLLQPYLPGQAPYFDPARNELLGPVALVSGGQRPWYGVTTIGINDGGYSGVYSTFGNTCTGKILGNRYGARKVSEIINPESRVAFAPTSYGGYGLFYFRSFDANRPNMTPASPYSNLVYDTMREGKVPVVHADGSAGTLTRADFADPKLQAMQAQYCKWLDAGAGKRWGRFYVPN